MHTLTPPCGEKLNYCCSLCHLVIKFSEDTHFNIILMGCIPECYCLKCLWVISNVHHWIKSDKIIDICFLYVKYYLYYYPKPVGMGHWLCLCVASIEFILPLHMCCQLSSIGIEAISLFYKILVVLQRISVVIRHFKELLYFRQKWTLTYTMPWWKPLLVKTMWHDMAPQGDCGM